MKHYLVTGGAGFIGVNLIKYLLKKGHSVTVWDNLITGFEKNVPSEAKFELVDINLVNKNITTHFDGIFNLACIASPSLYQKYSIQTIMTCTVGMINMLELAKTQKIPILQASTSEVYGDPDVHPQNEQYWGHVNCFGPRSCYDESKRCAETLCREYIEKYNVNVKIARIFNTYGPYMDQNDGRVISNFVYNALEGKDMVVYGDGEQTRSFCYVDDTVEGLYRLMNSFYNKPVNIGNPKEYTINEIASIIKQRINPNINIINADIPEDDPLQRCPDICLAHTILDRWIPKVTLEKGIEKMISHIKDK
jgi:UDP-glucuronate decarboxylase